VHKVLIESIPCELHVWCVQYCYYIIYLFIHYLFMLFTVESFIAWTMLGRVIKLQPFSLIRSVPPSPIRWKWILGPRRWSGDVILKMKSMHKNSTSEHIVPPLSACTFTSSVLWFTQPAALLSFHITIIITVSLISSHFLTHLRYYYLITSPHL